MILALIPAVPTVRRSVQKMLTSQQLHRRLAAPSSSCPEVFHEIPPNQPSQIQNEKASSSKFQSNYQQLMEASTLSLAPMMEYTDRHFRHLVRLISDRTLVYSEMVTSNAIAHERRHHMAEYQQQHPTASWETVQQSYEDAYIQRFLGQSQLRGETPSVLQLGGSDPQVLYETSQAVYELMQRGICNYTALNLNCGCPSPKVAGKGCFGAALMSDPSLVAQLTTAMHHGCRGELPVTVKCRIGTDATLPERFTQRGYATLANDPTEYSQLQRFIETVAAAGVVTDFAVHARIAVLQKSFSPTDNRKVPPLKYETVRRLVQDYPDLTFSLNGGIETIAQVQEQLVACPGLKGVMIGRAFAADPWSFAMADEVLYGQQQQLPKNRWQILQEYGKHADLEEATWDPVKIRRFIIKAITPLFSGELNAKRYRIALDEIAGLPKKLQGKSLDSQPPLSELILDAATKHLSEEALFRTPQESYGRVLWEEQKLRTQATGRSRSVMEWQSQRTEEGPRVVSY